MCIYISSIGGLVTKKEHSAVVYAVRCELYVICYIYVVCVLVSSVTV